MYTPTIRVRYMNVTYYTLYYYFYHFYTTAYLIIFSNARPRAVQGYKDQEEVIA